MKISKLFHWLYAILMLLPFAFFVPSVLYYAFNDNATMQTIEVPKTETVVVDFKQELDSLRNDFTSVGITFDTNNDDYSIYVDGTNTYTLNTAVTRSAFHFVGNHQYYIRSIDLLSGLTISVNYSDIDYTQRIYIPSVDGDYYLNVFAPNGMTFDGLFHLNVFDLTQMFGSGNEPTIADFNLIFPSVFYPYNADSEFMQITYDTGETEQLVENTSIINYAWESIWDLPLFNWCKVSFVSVPFTYITGLFGLGASNSFNYVFTYFASMSIIWLVFDVVLYVPLLVHRWLDKGIVE